MNDNQGVTPQYLNNQGITPTQAALPVGYVGDTIIANGLPYDWNGSGYQLRSETSA